MLLDKTKLVKPGFINTGCRGGRGWLLECNIEGIVRKVTLFLKYSQPFLSKIESTESPVVINMNGLSSFVRFRNNTKVSSTV